MIKKLLFISVFFLTVILNSSMNFEQTGLTVKWETKGFDTPECVLFNSEEEILYVSNIGGKQPTEKDGNGFISKLSLDGKIVKLKWVIGLDAPKGMTISGDYLYVTDISRVVKINIAKGTIIREIDIPGAVFLNDLASVSDGNIVVSDSKTQTFHLITGDKHKVLLKDKEFTFPNGITNDDEDLFAGVGNKIVKIDIEEGVAESYIENTGGVDGIAEVEDDLFVISDWGGKVHLVSPEKEKILILDTTKEENVNTADFCYLEDSKKLFIPTFFNNSIRCYKLQID